MNRDSRDSTILTCAVVIATVLLLIAGGFAARLLFGL
jgi:hypothetical protein